jgi:nitrogen fixation NifU-like protein
MEPSEIDDLYHEVILDHCRNPHNQDALDDPDVSARGVNPFCGDEVDLQIVLDSGRVSRTGVQSKGCSISRAAASLLSDAVQGKTIDEIETMAAGFRRMMTAPGSSTGNTADLGDLQALSGVHRFPVRIKCALLAWSALEDGIVAYRSTRGA